MQAKVQQSKVQQRMPSTS